MKVFTMAGVIAMALAAMTTVASADEAMAPAPPTAAPEPASTPLATRPSKPLTLASTSEGTPFGYKLLAGMGVAVAAGLWLRKKRGRRPVLPPSRIDVLGRTSLGVRSELLVVEVEGTRLLVGMTPSAIQTLAVLDGAEGAEGAEGAPALADPAPERETEDERPPMLEVADRARVILDGIRAASASAPAVAASKKRAAPARPAKKDLEPAKSAQPTKISRVAGQARGLLLALEPAGEEPADNGASARHTPAERPIRLGDW